jgi:hypothetical protein
MKTSYKKVIKYFGVFLLLEIILSGCSDVLEYSPYNQVSEDVFWKNNDDAFMGLVGVYRLGSAGTETDFLTETSIFFMDQKSDNAYVPPDNFREAMINGTDEPTNTLASTAWSNSYNRIGRANYFLENIDKVNMDQVEKDEMKAEARVIRAIFYFYMTQFYGGVPLITGTLTVDEANNVSRASKEEVVTFVLSELTEAANDLPATRPASERGRITKAAALAFKGRLQMAEQKWADAALTYKSIIDLGVHIIDPRYKELFIEAGENSLENIFSTQYTTESGSSQAHYRLLPRALKGASQIGILNSLVEAYECIDGKTINESPLYDPQNPYVIDNVPYRDPRLYYTVILPNVSKVKGVLYVTHPDSTKSLDQMPTKAKTGYGYFKYLDEAFNGDTKIYGGDKPIVRYAEVLLSYLESKLEAGDQITQELLDQTINMVRGRESVNMPPITEIEKDKLRIILRRERRVELALEGIRYWDLLRWHIAHIELNKNTYGAKVCDGQSNCKYQVDENGYYFLYKRGFRENVDYHWPIPQDQIDINPNLEQNPGY